MKYLLIACLLFFVVGCKPTPTAQTITGQTWTTYTVKLQAPNSKTQPLQFSIDSLLAAIDQSVSTYIETSTISKFNQNNAYYTDAMSDSHFRANIRLAMEVFDQTHGAFDPTVKTLVDYYGFGKNKNLSIRVDSLVVDSMMQWVGFGRIREMNVEDLKNVQLDFSASAKGYMVDQVGELLEKRGYYNYLVEIGGEVKAEGVNFELTPWSLGIEEPLENTTPGQQIHAIIPLTNQSMATSGNYRNFKIIEGQKVAHTINPITGYPEISNLLSATIITQDCAFADAYATACMVMGLEKSMEWIENRKGVEGYLIYSNDQGVFESFASTGIRDLIVNPN